MNEANSKLTTDNLKVKAAKGAGVNVVLQLLGTVFHIAGVVVLARFLTPKDFGLVAMVTAFSQWIMNFGVNGFTEYIIQKQDLSVNTVNSIFWVHVLLSSVLAAGFAVFGFILVDFYAEPALSGIAAAMATSFIFYALFTSHTALLRREMKFASVAIIELAAVILSTAIAVAAALGGMAYWAVVIRQLMIPVVTMIAVWIISTWRPGAPRHLSDAFPGLKYAFQVYCNYSLGYVTRNLDKVLLGKFHGSAMLGNYDRAYHLSSLPVGQLLSPIDTVAFATLARLRNDKERFFLYFTKAISMVAFLGTIAALLLILSAKDLILLLLGPEWSEAGLVVVAFSPGIAAALLYGTHPWLHLSLGTPDRWLRWNLVASLFTITAFVIAAPFGAVAMAIAYSATSYLLVLPSLWYAGRPIQLSLIKVIECIWTYFAAAFAVFFLWFFLSSHWLPLKALVVGLSPLQRLLLVSIAASSLYMTTVIILQRNFSSIREMISLLRIMLSRKGPE